MAVVASPIAVESAPRRELGSTSLPEDDFDPLPDERVLKTGWLNKKGRRGNWKRRWFVLRSDRLAYYKDEKEYKTLRIIPALEINTATAIKSKKPHTFAVFTSSRTYTLSAPSETTAQEWIKSLLHASNVSAHRCEEELGLDTSPAAPLPIPRNKNNLPALDTSLPSQSSSIPSSVPLSAVSPASGHHPSQDLQRVASYASDAGYFSGPELGTSPFDNSGPSNDPTTQEVDRQSFESDELEGLAEDRVVAQGYLLCLKNVSGVRQWKRRWVVLRGRSLTLYKNFEEYKPLRIIPLHSILAAVDTDPLSRTKRHCFQVVTKEKVFRFCADSEAEVDRWLGGLVSLIEGGKSGGQGLGGAKVE